MKPTKRLALTDQCRHVVSLGELPYDLQKYWYQRYDIFSNYDDGIVMTDDAWFGVTPEPVAETIASDLQGWEHPKTTVVDMFAGAGGNTIAFALSGQYETIIAVEKDPATLACAQHNAALNGVYKKVTWILGDCFEYLEKLQNCPDELDPKLQVDLKATILFASPPWGGPGYNVDQVFDLSRMEPYNLAKLHDACKAADSALYLPRTSDIRQIARLVPDGQKIDVVQYCINGSSKAMVAYLPCRAEKPLSGQAMVRP